MSGFNPRFFAPSGAAGAPPGIGSVLTLDAEDSHHALRVLRLRPGDECEMVVGDAVYAATVVGADRAVSVELGPRLEGAAAGASYRFPVALVQAVARPAAVDWSIEKSTEAGVSLILLVQAAGSPRSSARDSSGRPARWDRIAREAAKQSKQPAIPAVELHRSFAASLDHLRSIALRSVLLDPGAEQTLYDLLRSRSGASGSRAGESGVALWVGPEGGWTDAERESLLSVGMTAARLGRGVLRTETAGPVAVAVARLALGDW
jgi:16S rRNA (uracil1498-N3)-methyltransferase